VADDVKDEVQSAVAASRPTEDLFRFLNRTSAYLKSSRDLDAALRHYVRESAEYFGAEEAALIVLEPGRARPEILFAQPAEATWDLAFFEALIRKRHPRFPRGTICASVPRRERSWGVVVLRRAPVFERWAERGIARVADEMATLVERLDKERLAEVRARIDRKIVRRLPPVDVYYHVLDGLHTLTGYDHSAALFMLDPASRSLTLVAERIAWEKRKSTRIGEVVPLPDEVRTSLGEGAVYGFDRGDGAWNEWTNGSALALAELVGRPDGDGVPREAALLCASLGTADGAVGILVIAALRPGTFGPWERRILQEFAWLAGFVLERAQSLANLQATMIGAHRRHALADLARGVAHDLNNAMGEMIPLTQQMQSDLASGAFETKTFTEDVARLHESLQVCRRIFGSMLRFARGSQRTVGWGNVRKALDGTIAVLRESFERQRVTLELAIPEDLPDVRCGQADLEQLFLNLATNARESMPTGGTLAIRVTPGPERVEVRFVDTGSGIPPELLAQIEQPFFSTKAEGTGLGLSTCRAIVVEARGAMRIESIVDFGTTIVLEIPTASGTAA
jgi:two-component system, NtrC family, sensor kinase